MAQVCARGKNRCGSGCHAEPKRLFCTPSLGQTEGHGGNEVVARTNGAARFDGNCRQRQNPFSFDHQRTPVTHAHGDNLCSTGLHHCSRRFDDPVLIRKPVTGKLLHLPETRLDHSSLANLLGRVGEAEDVANVVAFLCLPESRHITGQMIHVSGGAVV